MKKVITILLSVFLVLSLVGCNNSKLCDLEEEFVTAESRGLSFKAEKEIYTAEDTVINYIIENKTQKRQEIGNGHWLHYKTEDGWKKVGMNLKNKKNVKYKINAVNKILFAQQSGTFTISLSNYKTPLPKGEYRIERYGMVSESFMVE